MKNFKQPLKPLFWVSLCCALFLSCTNAQKQQSIYTKRAFQIFTSEDNNWTTSGEYSADSIRFKTKNEATIWIDGKPMTIYSNLIKVYQNK